MGKIKKYMVLDTETTRPFIEGVDTNGMIFPMVYDIGYVIVDKKGVVYKKVNRVVQEIFYNKPMMSKAFFSDKYDGYLKAIQEGKLVADSWNNIMNMIQTDLQECECMVAYNSAFDNRAIKKTAEYIKSLYNNTLDRYYEKVTYVTVNFGDKLKNGKPMKNDIIDLWGLCCKYLINNDRYKQFCVDNEYVSEAGNYRTGAEIVYRYLFKDNEFIEDHTALSDAQIEAQILTKVLEKKGNIKNIQNIFFPFKLLGNIYKD